MSKRIDLNYEDLCNLIANNVHKATPSSVNNYLRGIYKTILRQLELNKKIYFKNFGSFEIKMRKEETRLINNPADKTKQIVHIEPKYIISFTPSSILDYSINQNDFKMLKSNAADSARKKINKSKRSRKKKKIDITTLLNKANIRQEKGLIANGEELLYRTKIN